MVSKSLLYLAFNTVTKLLSHFLEKVSFLKQKRLVYVYLDKNRPEEKVQSPIVGVEMYEGNEVYDPKKCKIYKHAVVLKDHKQWGF